MELTFLRSKLHEARVTQTSVDYDGSCAIDSDLMKLADISEYQQVDIYNLDNGERLTTYAITAEAGSATVSLNGAAAYKGKVGDKIIICTYAHFSEAEAALHKPILVYLDEHNQPLRISNRGYPHLSSVPD